MCVWQEGSRVLLRVRHTLMWCGPTENGEFWLKWSCSSIWWKQHEEESKVCRTSGWRQQSRICFKSALIGVITAFGQRRDSRVGRKEGEKTSVRKRGGRRNESKVRERKIQSSDIMSSLMGRAGLSTWSQPVIGWERRSDRGSILPESLLNIVISIW